MVEQRVDNRIENYKMWGVVCLKGHAMPHILMFKIFNTTCEILLSSGTGKKQ